MTAHAAHCPRCRPPAPALWPIAVDAECRAAWAAMHAARRSMRDVLRFPRAEPSRRPLFRIAGRTASNQEAVLRALLRIRRAMKGEPHPVKGGDGAAIHS